MKAIQKMEFLELDKDEPTINLNFLDAQKTTSSVLRYENVTLGYDDKTILQKTLRDFYLPMTKLAL